MIQTLLLSCIMATLWMIIANQITIPGFIVGFIFGLSILILMRLNSTLEPKRTSIHPTLIPGQIAALLTYTLRLSIDVLLSGTDVAKRVLSPALPIDPDIQRVSTQDPDNDILVSGLSAHSITITPGELVIDFEEDESGQTIMLVHVLDRNASTLEKLNQDQTNRLKLIKRILGHE